MGFLLGGMTLVIMEHFDAEAALGYTAVRNYPQPVGANDVHQDAEIG